MISSFLPLEGPLEAPRRDTSLSLQYLRVPKSLVVPLKSMCNSYQRYEIPPRCEMFQKTTCRHARVVYCTLSLYSHTHKGSERHKLSSNLGFIQRMLSFVSSQASISGANLLGCFPMCHIENSMENAIHQSLIRSSTIRGGAPRDTSMIAKRLCPGQRRTRRLAPGDATASTRASRTLRLLVLLAALAGPCPNQLLTFRGMCAGIRGRGALCVLRTTASVSDRTQRSPPPDPRPRVP